eukprot:7553468-Lingulodinium_polyedra.AAC.1
MTVESEAWRVEVRHGCSRLRLMIRASTHVEGMEEDGAWLAGLKVSISLSSSQPAHARSYQQVSSRLQPPK